MNSAEIRMSVAMIEIVNLAELLDQLTEVLTARGSEQDPAVSRLTPNPYPMDPEAAAEFTNATRDDLIERRMVEAALVRSALDAYLGPNGPDERSEVEVVVSGDDVDVWLRTLTALRLVIANRLDVTDDSDLEENDDPRFGVFHWLGYRLDNLIGIADALDENDGRDDLE